MRVLTCSLLMCMAMACGLDSHKKPDASAGAGATGGSGSGGSGGTSGTGGASGAGATGGTGGTSGLGGTGGVPSVECENNSDCVVGGGCCDCWSAPVGEARAVCLADCEQDLCAVHGLEPICNGGRCVLAATCDHGRAQCDAPTPQCPRGQTAVIREGCYGPCVDVLDCLQVTSCTDCGSENACIEQCRGELQCVDVPDTCNGTEGCECLSDKCEQPPFCLGWDAAERRLSCACEVG